MLSQMGINLPQTGSAMQLRNVAAVMVTAVLPPFSTQGRQIDVTVSSIGNAKSLRGGTLLMTPLRGADGQIYAMAQGNVLVGGVGASAPGGASSVQINHLSVGRVPAGATVERGVATPLGGQTSVQIELNSADFGTVQRVADAINLHLGEGTAVAVDGRVVRLAAPEDAGERVGFIARVQAIEVSPVRAAARVIVNARTGSVVMNQAVSVDTCAVAHGNLSVVISAEPVISQPAPFSRGGNTVRADRTTIEIREDKGGLSLVRGAALADIVKAINAMGATPQDMIAILQAMKAAGALRAELEVI